MSVLPSNAEKVLRFLSEEWSWDAGYFSFAGIINGTGLDRKQVRRACRYLARKGFAEFCRGLWNDEGPAGSGYGATKAGRELVGVQAASGGKGWG